MRHYYLLKYQKILQSFKILLSIFRRSDYEIVRMSVDVL